MQRIVPTDVYLDTNVLVSCAYPNLPKTEACQKAIQQLRDARSQVYISPLLVIEFAQAFRSLATRRVVSEALTAQFELRQWRDRRVRQRWMVFWRAELERLLASLPDNMDLPLNSAILHDCFDIVARFGLHSYDAVHLATALHYEIPVFWTCDDHFERVDDLYVEVIRNNP